MMSKTKEPDGKLSQRIYSCTTTLHNIMRGATRFKKWYSSWPTMCQALEVYLLYATAEFYTWSTARTTWR